MAAAHPPSLFDRLLNAEVAGRDGVRFRFSAEQVKDAVARDLEALLNATPAIPPEDTHGLPLVGRSIVNFGMLDITTLSLFSDRDRARIVESARSALAAHEPRLRQVEVTVRPRDQTDGRLVLAIRGQLALQPGAEAVAFDAVMQPGSTRYSVSRSGERVAPAAAPSAPGDATRAAPLASAS